MEGRVAPCRIERQWSLEANGHGVRDNSSLQARVGTRNEVAVIDLKYLHLERFSAVRRHSIKMSCVFWGFASKPGGRTG